MIPGQSGSEGSRARTTEDDDMRAGISHRSGRSFLLAVTSVLAAAAITACTPRAQDPLAAGFISPPPEARPWVYWMWVDGNLDRAGITADLESLKAAGIGGVVICEVNVGVPRGPV